MVKPTISNKIIMIHCLTYQVCFADQKVIVNCTETHFLTGLDLSCCNLKSQFPTKSVAVIINRLFM